MRRFILALLLAAIAISPAASRSSHSGTSGRTIASSAPCSHRGEARSEARNSSTSHTSRTRATGSHARPTPTRCTTCERDANGRIKRNPAARRAFQFGTFDIEASLSRRSLHLDAISPVRESLGIK